jgi:hypothetical protein
MAYGNRRRRSGGRRPAGSRGGGERRGGGSRRGGRPPARGGGSNATPTIVGIVLLVAVIGIVVLATSHKHGRAQAPDVSHELTGDSAVPDKTAQGPKKPERPAPPKLPDEILANAKRVVAEMVVDRKKGDALYDEAMRAKEKGDPDTWQAKLRQASLCYDRINDRWNSEVIEEIDQALPAHVPGNWDAEELANHWLGDEGNKVSAALKKLAYIKKQLRAK